MSAHRRFAQRGNIKIRNDRALHGPQRLCRDDLLDGRQHDLRGPGKKQIRDGRPLNDKVAAFISILCVDQRDIRLERWNKQQLLPRKRTGHALVFGM